VVWRRSAFATNSSPWLSLSRPTTPLSRR
jgi:hypothetical protein